MVNKSGGIPLQQLIGQIMKDLATTPSEEMQRRQNEVERTGKPYDLKDRSR